MDQHGCQLLLDGGDRRGEIALVHVQHGEDKRRQHDVRAALTKFLHGAPEQSYRWGAVSSRNVERRTTENNEL